ncbi:alpha/beta hydrolase [Luteimonas sp. RD2P54]|uniref:Alpha/beta hydrolase n=1 Tax=Luteimonas endophytica TaxID=3042023 RepID=A0ABT6J717_9GAMM|nr:alpha/beta hydrolase [Luteimonas endophytica]MDH5822544.1 alpha/beta hydrolase [Luteimonas endophytica]
MPHHPLTTLLLAFALLAPAAADDAHGPLARWRALRDAPHRTDAGELPAGTRVLRDIAYGEHPRQRFDVYLPARAARAPVLLLVHGGGWAHGDKDHPGLIPDKARHWLARGWVLVSTNYRLLPEAAPLQQAGDVARALARVQAAAPDWGADPDRVVLMGHSAGAHLAALLGADPARLRDAGAAPPRGVVALDSAAMDVPQMMALPRRPRLYDRAFGEARSDWVAASPWHALARDALPMLAVCAQRRPDACPQAHALAEKAATLGARVEVLPQPLSHMAINRELGQPGAYTEAVDAFLRGLVATPGP